MSGIKLAKKRIFYPVLELARDTRKILFFTARKSSCILKNTIDTRFSFINISAPKNSLMKEVLF